MTRTSRIGRPRFRGKSSPVLLESVWRESGPGDAQTPLSRKCLGRMMQKKFGWRRDESSAHDALGVNAKSITVECHERERPTQHPPVQFLILVIQSLRFWRGR